MCEKKEPFQVAAFSAFAGASGCDAHADLECVLLFLGVFSWLCSPAGGSYRRAPSIDPVIECFRGLIR